MLALSVAATAQEQAGSLRGMVYDADFDAPLGAARIVIVETGQEALTTTQGNFVIAPVQPGRYTLVFSKQGYVRQVKADVVVSQGKLTDVEVSLAGDFTEMDEFVVQDFRIGGASEAALLELRFESPSLMDSISADLMSRAGASDAAGALRLVPGATVQDGKFAVIRGLPDRYVSSQMNGFRLPSADEEKRAVELDQFPTTVLESIQVTKTFTPDQQGDASGGAVDVRLKGMPDGPVFQLKGQLGYNSQATGESGFLTYDAGSREIQYENLGGNWEGDVGVSEGDAPIEHKWAGAIGGSTEILDGVRIGGSASLFYERDSAHTEGIDHSLWVENVGGPLTPETKQGTPEDGDFKTALFDVTKSRDTEQWGGLFTLGLETDRHTVGATYLYTFVADDVATLAEDTKGKEYFFPGYDPNDPRGEGNLTPLAAPYVRTETLEYTERTTSTLQFTGEHTLPELKPLWWLFQPPGTDGLVKPLPPKLDWGVAFSSAELDQPDKRQFGSLWQSAYRVGRFLLPAEHLPFKPAANFTLGNAQRIFKRIEEQSDQYFVDLELPFEQPSGNEGYAKFGWFLDKVDREFQQETFSNFNDNAGYQAEFEEFWSGVFPSENHPITESLYDINYDGRQDVSAWYGMLDVPFSSTLNVIGGFRFESTDLGVVVDPDENATWFEPGELNQTTLEPGEADVDFEQDDVLPSIGLVYTPVDQLTLRAAYSETVARQTFRELTPVIQQEFLGGPIFIGNPELRMAALRNTDLRVDYTPYEGGFLSVSWFNKDMEDPIEYVQKIANAFTYTTAVNYPKGNIRGWEIEVRHDLDRFWEGLGGLSLGANATFIDSEVTLPDDEAAALAQPDISAPMTTRDATNAPEHLYNLYLTYDHAPSGTQAALFYSVFGDTLVAGAGEDKSNFIPSVYEKEYGTLNFSLSRKLSDRLKLEFKAKNLTNPKIQEVYRSSYVPGGDAVKTSFRAGIELSLGISFSL